MDPVVDECSVMTRKSPLPIASEAPRSLGLKTIMSRDLAALHGIDYVHIAAFAIDLDRIREGIEIDPSAKEWPFGWEVFLTECFLRERLDPTIESHQRLVEDLCWSIFEFGPGDPRLGGQVLFAVYSAIHSGAWPASWKKLFHGWLGKPDGLMAELEALQPRADELRTELSQLLVHIPVEPPMAPTSLEVIVRWAGLLD